MHNSPVMIYNQPIDSSLCQGLVLLFAVMDTAETAMNSKPHL